MGTVTALAFKEPEEDPKVASTNKAKVAKSKRNVNGEGNIRQRRNGTWEGRAYVITTDGREVRKSVYGKTWDEAHEKLTKLQADTMSGKRTASTKMTVGEYLTYWLREIVRHRVNDKTYDDYEYLVRMYLIPLFGKSKLTKLQARDIRRGFHKLKLTCQCCRQGKDRARQERAEKLRTARAGKPTRKNTPPIVGARCCARTPTECCHDVLSDGTVRLLHQRLRTALQDAITEEGILTENPARNLRLRYRYRPKFNAWSADEARQFLKAAGTHRLGALYSVALLLGLRRGEVLGLSWKYVDLDRAVIEVKQALQRAGGELRLGPVKTEGSEASVAIPAPCVKALSAHRTRQESEHQAWKERRKAESKRKPDQTKPKTSAKWNPDNLVFTTEQGTPIEPANVNKYFAALCDQAGVRRIRVHDLRHSCATLLYEMGVPIEHIQDVLRHSTPIITKTLYVDGTERVRREAADQLGDLFAEDDDG